MLPITDSTKNPIHKREPLQLLKYSKSVSTSVGAVSVLSFGLAAISLLIQLINFSAIRGLSLDRQQPTLVQLADGNTFHAQAANPSDRSPEVIKKFISDTFTKMFNWDGILQTVNNKGEPMTESDPGIEVKAGDIHKVTTKAYEATFSLSENEGFRSAFLKKLAEMTPLGIFSGQMQVALVPRFISDPRQVRNGVWDIDLIATLVTFEKQDNSGNGIAFNKTIRVEAVTTPQETNTTALANVIYAARRSGLEITQIYDLDLGKHEKSDNPN